MRGHSTWNIRAARASQALGFRPWGGRSSGGGDGVGVRLPVATVHPSGFRSVLGGWPKARGGSRGGSRWNRRQLTNRPLTLGRSVGSAMASLAVVASSSCDSNSAQLESGGRGGRVDTGTLINGQPTAVAWEDGASFQEDLRIGALDGTAEYIFGDVTEIVPDGRGGFYVFDRHVPALRQYGRDGRFVRTLGRQGSGPGEYGDAILGLAVGGNGRLAAYDVQNGRVNFYSHDGLSAGQLRPRITSALYADRSLALDSLGYIYLRIMTVDEWPPPEPWPIGFAQIDERGEVVDTLGPPAVHDEPPPDPGPRDRRKVWAISPYFTVVGVNDSYSFEIRERNGGIVRVSREMPETPLAFRGFRIAADERIWVELDAPGDGRVDRRYDVFERDGEYVGRVRLPADISLRWIGKEVAFGVLRGPLDEQYVVRLRLMMPRSQ